MLAGMAASFRHAAPARALALVLPTCLLVLGAAPPVAQARGEWYVGAGASAAFLRPDGQGRSPTPSSGTASSAGPLPAPSDPAPPRSADGVSSAAAPRTFADDADGDGVEDDADLCPASAVGFPVRDNGCALLDGVLVGVDFVDGTATLAPGAAEQLDLLANVLVRYPEARIKLLAHTDDTGSVREQSIRTRARLRTIGLYLVQQRGIRSNRIVLRSLGGTRPLYDDTTLESRRLNDRIEVRENTD